MFHINPNQLPHQLFEKILDDLGDHIGKALPEEKDEIYQRAEELTEASLNVTQDDCGGVDDLVEDIDKRLASICLSFYIAYIKTIQAVAERNGGFDPEFRDVIHFMLKKMNSVTDHAGEMRQIMSRMAHIKRFLEDPENTAMYNEPTN